MKDLILETFRQWEDGLITKQERNLKIIQDCGAGVKFYHSSVTHGDGTTRVVCEKKCQGLKVLREFERTQLKML